MSPLANSIVPIAPSAMIVVFASRSSRQRALAAPPSARRRSSRPGNAAGSNGSGSTVGLCMTRLVLIVAFLGCSGVRSSVPPRPYNPAPTSLEPGSIDPLEALVIIAAGMAAGTINTIVGSGSLITFPTLLLLGYPPLVANVSNTVGLVPGTISGAIGYRRELHGQRARARPLVIAAGLGGLTGAALLLVLPASAFARIVPVLILAGLRPGGRPAATLELGRRAARPTGARAAGRGRAAARPRAST